MAMSYTEIAQTQFGDKHFGVWLVTGDSSDTTVTPASIDMAWIDVAWTQNVDSTTSSCYISDYASDPVADNAIDFSAAPTSGETRLLFVLGVKNY